eukprot:gene11517-4681_t
MMNRSFLKLLLLITVFSVQVKTCILWKNTKIDTTFSTNSTVKFTVKSTDRQQWMGLGFGKNDNYLNANFIIFHHPNKILKMNSSNVVNLPITKDFYFDDSDWVSFDNVLQYHFNLDAEDLKNQTYLFFIKDKVQLSNSSSLLSTTTIQIESKKFKILTDEQSNCFGRVIGNGRIDAQNNYTFVTTMIIYVILFALLMYFRNINPLKSRNIGPATMVFIQYINMCGYYLQTYWNYEERNYYLCYIEAYLIYPMTQISFIIPAILLLRFLAIIRIRYQKILQYHEDEKQYKLPFHLILLKQLGTPWILIWFPVAIYIISTTFLTIVLASNNFKCSKIQDTIFVYWHGFFASILAFFYFFLTFYDYAYNTVTYLILKKCQFRDFVRSDQFYFRFETIFGFGLYFIFMIFVFTDHPDLIHFSLVALMNWYVLFVIVGIPLVVSMFRYFIKRVKNKKKMTKENARIVIRELFKDSELIIIFRKFAEKEYSIENVLFRDDYSAYQKIKNEEMLRVKAEEILEKFFFSTSSYELNVRGKGIKRIQERLTANDDLPTLFDEVMNEVELNLADTYSRFIMSQAYIVLTQSRAVKNQILVDQQSSHILV